MADTKAVRDWIDLMFDIDKRREAFDAIRQAVGPGDEPIHKLIEALEKGYEDAWFEGRWTDGFLEASGEMVHEIARSMPAPMGISGRGGTNMARYWRWALMEDCMANVPDQVERCMQALCAAQFDMGLMQATIDRTWKGSNCPNPGECGGPYDDHEERIKRNG